MAANRKLQGEIDRTLKKVQEGVELFDEIWEKVYSAQNQNQKEKFESELKSQIKKLQRYRDDIKTWITNSDIKDKRPLTDARKLIETEMERFKVCEKEFKTKAFSKEGLSQAAKEDPKDKERNKVRKWITASLETFQERKDVYEAELETINSAKKKKKDTGAAKWEDLIERCKFHEERLELVLRLIDNESLSAEDCDVIKEQLEYLLEVMVDGNYDEVDGIDDDGIYEELGLDELNGDDDGGPAAEPPPPAGKGADKTPEKKKSAKEIAEEEKKEKEKKKEKAAVMELPSINAAALKAKPKEVLPPVTSAKAPMPKDPAAAPLGATKLPSGTTAAAAVASGLGAPATAAAAAARGKAGPVPLTAAAAAAGGRSAAAAAAGAPAGLPRPGGLPGGLPGGPTLADAARGARKDEAAPSAAALGGKGGAAATAAAAVAGVGAAAAAAGGGLPPPGGRGAIGNLGGLDTSSGGVPGGLPPPPGPQGGEVGGSSGLAALGGAMPSDTAEDEVVPAGATGLANLVPGGGAAGGGAPAAASDGLPLADDLDQFEEQLLSLAARPRTNPLLEDDRMTQQLLQFSLLNKPEPSDSERPRTYVPRNPYPTPNSFPQTPAAVFDAPSTFDKFDTDTLFFVFYYQQGTYQQYLAARELKKQSWRYHKKYLTWFQRHEEPKVTAEDYEQGTYVYFDYETGWCQRIKSDFTFEYGYLEDELQV